MSIAPIPSIALVWEAATEIYGRRGALLQAVILPILGLSSIALFTNLHVTSAPGVIFSFLAGTPFYVIFATACHRLILLGDNSLPNRWGLFWSDRETRFFGWLIVIGLLYFALSLSTLMIFAVIPTSVFSWSILWLPTYVGYFVAAYFEGRFSLVLPATAIGKRIYLRGSWALSYGNGLLIAIALLIPALVLDLVEYFVFSFMIDAGSPFIDFLWGLVIFPFFAVEVAIITVAYRKLAMRDDI